MHRARGSPYAGAQRPPTAALVAVAGGSKSAGERADGELNQLHGVSLGERENRERERGVAISGDPN